MIALLTSAMSCMLMVDALEMVRELKRMLLDQFHSVITDCLWSKQRESLGTGWESECGNSAVVVGDGEERGLECWGLVGKGGGRDGGCCYAVESPWALARSTRGWSGLSYIMTQRFIWPIYWGLCQEPHRSKQSLCQFPNPSSTPWPLPLEVTELQFLRWVSSRWKS